MGTDLRRSISLHRKLASFKKIKSCQGDEHWSKYYKIKSDNNGGGLIARLRQWIRNKKKSRNLLSQRSQLIDKPHIEDSLKNELFIDLCRDREFSKQSPNESNSEAMQEFKIAFKDLIFGDCVRIGHTHSIHKGRWHGDVVIHSYRNLCKAEVVEFLKSVSRLSLIRHENIDLFMGACTDDPQLAIVTSIPKARSLFEETRERLLGENRNSIIRQIVQALTYLHSKDIVVAKLCSKNIFLENKVKLCLMDYAMAREKYDRPDYGSITKGHLTYIAPEIMRLLIITTPRIQSVQCTTTKSNIFAFGTILYEIMTSEYPLKSTPEHSIIWRIGSGHFTLQEDMVSCKIMKKLILNCWSMKPSDRMDISEIMSKLQTNIIRKFHSISQPEAINNI